VLVKGKKRIVRYAGDEKTHYPVERQNRPQQKKKNKSYEANNNTFKRRSKLRRAEKALGGVPPEGRKSARSGGWRFHGEGQNDGESHIGSSDLYKYAKAKAFVGLKSVGYSVPHRRSTFDRPQYRGWGKCEE